VDLLKIFVLLGTQDKPFTRLTDKIEEYANKNKDEITVQSGHTPYKSKKVKVYDFISMNELKKLIKDSDLIITHGGVGSIIDSIKENKKVIVVPRLKKYKEHTNDHQLEITEAFAKMNYIMPLYDINDLDKAIKDSKKFKPNKYKSNNKEFIKLIENKIESYLK
jgi:UDP-N-acetylglucosamine transferase subunit ALG13